jgi:hypothetical protein
MNAEVYFSPIRAGKSFRAYRNYGTCSAVMSYGRRAAGRASLAQIGEVLAALDKLNRCSPHPFPVRAWPKGGQR